jgi:predicted lactoylglutathione lyase
LALHQIAAGELPAYRPPTAQFLDHIGVILQDPSAVDHLYKDIEGKIASLGGAIAKPPKQHRDGSYSFYFSDPDGNVIQALYEPRISQRS